MIYLIIPLEMTALTSTDFDFEKRFSPFRRCLYYRCLYLKCMHLHLFFVYYLPITLLYIEPCCFYHAILHCVCAFKRFVVKCILRFLIFYLENIFTRVVDRFNNLLFTVICYKIFRFTWMYKCLTTVNSSCLIVLLCSSLYFTCKFGRLYLPVLLVWVHSNVKLLSSCNLSIFNTHNE